MNKSIDFDSSAAGSVLTAAHGWLRSERGLKIGVAYPAAIKAYRVHFFLMPLKEAEKGRRYDRVPEKG
jgi:hypothetical protein